tara:strand:- start:2562 stop:2897 length:336 start_codon:yes stop_codon:yes gene_type:complete
MSEHYQNSPQPDSHSSSSYFTVFCEEETFDIYFKCGWASSLEDISGFASMLHKINSGLYETEILKEIERQCSADEDGGDEQFFAFLTFYEEFKNKSKKSDLVVRPTQVKFD